MRAALNIALPLLLVACGPQTSNTAQTKPVAKAAKSHGKCPNPDLIDPKDPCSIAYLAPYKPAVKRDKF